MTQTVEKPKNSDKILSQHNFIQQKF